MDVASSDPRTESLSERWLPWLWILIVVPGLVLGWLAWRAVVNEQGFLREQIAEGRLRLASQVAGILQGAGREYQHQATVELASWVLEARDAPELPLPEPFDAVAVFHDGRMTIPVGSLVEDAPKVDLDTALAALLAQISRLGPQDGLALAERFLMDAFHAPAPTLTASLSPGIDRLEKAIEVDLSMEPHWRPVFEDLFDGIRRRMGSLAICRGKAPLVAGLARGAKTGIVHADGYSWLVLAPPDLPEGEVAVAAFSEKALEARLANDLPGFDGDSGSVRLGLRSAASGDFRGDSSARTCGAPVAEVAVPGGFPAWSVVAWSDPSAGDSAARFRSAFIAALLGLSIAILVGAAWLATRSLASQKQLLSMKTDFVSNVTHELKTPLTGIALYAELLAGGKAEGRSKEFGAIVLREAKRLEGMINGILSFAKQEAAHAEARRDRVPLDDIARAGCESFRGVASQRGIQIACEVERIDVPGDPALLGSIVGNLVDNAVKYGKQDGFVHLSLCREGGKAVLRVRDDGRGIPKDQQERVFERFFRGGGELTRNVPGTGLGLAIVKRSVQIHGGDIVLHSDVGSGTTIEVQLPISENEHA